MNREAVFVLHSLAVGGAERHASMIANYFAEHGIKVYIVLLDNSKICYELHPETEVYSFNCSEEGGANRCRQIEILPPKKTSVFKGVELKLYKVFGKNKLSIAETENYLKCNYADNLKKFFMKHSEATVISFMNIPTISSAIALHNLKNDFVFFEFSDPNAFFTDRGMYGVLKKYISEADAGIFQTDDEAVFYGFANSLKKFVIPNPLDCRTFPKPYTSARAKKIVNFCRVTTEKNLPLLIDAFELLRKDYPEYSVEIYGDGAEKQNIIEYIEKKGLSDVVSVLPERRDVLECVKNSAMFVSTSNREGISNSMLEAMAIGLPCICTDCPAGGAKMMINNRENGLLIPMNDVDALYKAMKELIDNAELTDKISKNAVKIRDRLEPDKICSQVMDAVFGAGGNL